MNYSDDDTIITDERWEQNGKLSRRAGPATIERDDWNGNVVNEQWFEDDEPHREDGPAFIGYDHVDDPDRVLEERWYKNGKRHRRDGPAIIKYDEATGSTVLEEWWIRGKQVDPKTMHPLHPVIPRAIKNGPNI